MGRDLTKHLTVAGADVQALRDELTDVRVQIPLAETRCINRSLDTDISLGNLQMQVSQDIASTNRRLRRIESRVDAIENRLVQMETRLVQLETRLVQLETNLSKKLDRYAFIIGGVVLAGIGVSLWKR